MPYVVADNRLAENSQWHTEYLSKAVQRMAASGFKLQLTGLKDYELKPLLGAEWKPPRADGRLPDPTSRGGKSVTFDDEQWETISNAITAVETKFEAEKKISPAQALVFIVKQWLAT